MNYRLKSIIRKSNLLEELCAQNLGVHGITAEDYLSQLQIVRDQNMLSIILPRNNFSPKTIHHKNTTLDVQNRYDKTNNLIHDLIKNWLLSQGVSGFEDEGYENGESFFISDDLMTLKIN